MKLRVAVIGVGRNGHHFVEHYGQDPHVGEIVIAEPSEPLRLQYGSLPKVVKRYASGEEFFAHDGADVVSIHTPTRLHADCFIKAARRGCHIFVEKPLAETIEDVRAMIDAARTNRGHKMAVGHNYRFEGYSPQVKRLVDEGQLGDIVCIRAGYVADYIYQWLSEPPSVYADPRAFIRNRTAMLDGACHHIDLANWFTASRPVSVCSVKKTFEAGGHPNDWIASVFQYANGTMLHMDACWGVVVPHKPFFGIEVYGTKGTIRDLTLYRFKNNDYHSQPYEAVPLRSCEQTGHQFAEEATTFLRAVIENQPVAVTVPEGANAAAAAIVAAQAADAGQMMEIPHFG